MNKAIFPLWLALATVPPAVAEQPSADSSLIPGQTIADSQGQLYRDVMRAFSQFVTEHYNCAPYNVLTTQRQSKEGRLVVDHDGHVMAGSVAERWDVDICGDKMKLAVDIAARDQWGTVVRFTKI